VFERDLDRNVPRGPLAIFLGRTVDCIEDLRHRHRVGQPAQAGHLGRHRTLLDDRQPAVVQLDPLHQAAE